MANKNTTLHFRISEQEKERIQQIADKKAMSMSEWLLYIIRKEIEKEGE